MRGIKLNRIYDYNELLEHIDDMTELYKPFLKVKEIGNSHDKRKIMMLKIGNGKKGIICCSGVHGRETVNPVVMLKMIECYLDIETGQKGLDIHGLWRKKIEESLKNYSFYFIPLLNPDGYMIALKGFHVIQNDMLRIHAKNMGISWKKWKYNARGIDINRNFPSVTWSEKHIINPVEKGAGFPASELETKALIKIFHKVNTIGFLDYHSRGKTIYYYRKAMTKEYNMKQKSLAHDIAKLTGYTLVPPEEELDEKETGGNTVHYYSEYKKKPAITIETVEESVDFPLSASCQSETFYEILKTPFLLCNKD